MVLESLPTGPEATRYGEFWHVAPQQLLCKPNREVRLAQMTPPRPAAPAPNAAARPPRPLARPITMVARACAGPRPTAPADGDGRLRFVPAADPAPPSGPAPPDGFGLDCRSPGSGLFREGERRRGGSTTSRRTRTSGTTHWTSMSIRQSSSTSRRCRRCRRRSSSRPDMCSISAGRLLAPPSVASCTRPSQLLVHDHLSGAHLEFIQRTIRAEGRGRGRGRWGEVK